MTLDERVEAFVAEVGTDGPVTVVGRGTRGGGVVGVRSVTAPAGIDWVQPAEMTIRCGAATPLAELEAALAEHGQCLSVPSGGTIGGALSVGRSDHRRLRWGPARDTVLQIRYVSSAGEVVKAGGPTVKNVSGFDLCRLLVGAHGTLGFLADVILRTRPISPHEQWFRSDADPWHLLATLYRPTSVLWDGATSWVLLEGHRDDVAAQATAAGLTGVEGPPPRPAFRRSVPPSDLASWRSRPVGSFLAEVGVGIVHTDEPAPRPEPPAPIVALHERIKREFDPTGRLNPGVDVLALGG